MPSRLGEPYVMLCFSVLAEAKADPDSSLWRAFKRAFNWVDMVNVDAFAVASWVGSWLHEHADWREWEIERTRNGNYYRRRIDTGKREEAIVW